MDIYGDDLLSIYFPEDVADGTKRYKCDDKFLGVDCGNALGIPPFQSDRKHNILVVHSSGQVRVAVGSLLRARQIFVAVLLSSDSDGNDFLSLNLCDYDFSVPNSDYVGPSGQHL